MITDAGAKVSKADANAKGHRLILVADCKATDVHANAYDCSQSSDPFK